MRIAALLMLAALSGGSTPKPPGEIVQSVTAYLSGEAMNSAWHVVASRAIVGRQMGKEPAYQWYLSVYEPEDAGQKLAYRSPGVDNQLLSKVEQAHGAELYFPRADLKIVGTGEFREQTVQEAVVQTHESAADCGASTVAVIGTIGRGEAVAPVVEVTNPCDLQASIVKTGSLATIRLTGPYYAKNAALCCPTKPRAVATLAYRNGKWTVTPSYFAVRASTSPATPQR